MPESDPPEFTIEARLRACMVLANTLQQTARQTSPYNTVGDRNPFSVSLLVCLTPPFCQTLADHLLAVRLALGDSEAFRPSPAPSRAALRLGDVLTVSAGAHPLEIGLVERVEGYVLAETGWSGLLWSDGRAEYDPAPMAVETLTKEAYADPERIRLVGDVYGPASDTLREGHDDVRMLLRAAVIVRHCHERMSYYYGLARGWHAAQRLFGGGER